MIIYYRVIIFNKDEILDNFVGSKTTILKQLNEYISSDKMNKNIKFCI